VLGKKELRKEGKGKFLTNLEGDYSTREKKLVRARLREEDKNLSLLLDKTSQIGGESRSEKIIKTSWAVSHGGRGKVFHMLIFFVESQCD